ncbi:MAG: ESX secretion-associated protein EspG [Sciscionella sp.]
MGKPSSVVLSALEFDVLWESERLPRRHVALDVPSPGRTHTERDEMVGESWESLRERGLVDARRVEAEIAEDLALLAAPSVAIDAWVWTDHVISALAASSGTRAVLAVVDGDEVWLIPARDSSLAEAAISIAGQVPAGRGHSVRLPSDVLRDADIEADGDPARLITCLDSRGITLSDAQVAVGMLAEASLRGQFGVQRRHRDGRVRRAERVVAFHDTAEGRYVYLTGPASDGCRWSTITPADNNRLAACLWELVGEF